MPYSLGMCCNKFQRIGKSFTWEWGKGGGKNRGPRGMSLRGNREVPKKNGGKEKRITKKKRTNPCVILMRDLADKKSSPTHVNSKSRKKEVVEKREKINKKKFSGTAGKSVTKAKRGEGSAGTFTKGKCLLIHRLKGTKNQEEVGEYRGIWSKKIGRSSKTH